MNVFDEITLMKKKIIIFSSISLLLNLALKINFDDTVNSSVFSNDEFSQEYFEQIISENENLSFREKSFLYDSCTTLIENEEYIVLSQVEKFLSNANISYDYESDYAYAVYQNHDYAISIKDNSFSNIIESYLLHEIGHGFTYTPTNTSRYLNELVNELFVKEACVLLNYEHTQSAYESDLVIARVLAEIVGDDVICKYKYDANLNYIKDKLMSYNISEEDYDLFITYLEELHIYFYRSSFDYDLRQNTYLKLFDILDLFYTKKYGYSITNDMELNFLLQYSVLKNKKIDDKVSEYIEVTINKNKDYMFSDDSSEFYPEFVTVSDKIIFFDSLKSEENKYNISYLGSEKLINSNFIPNDIDLIFVNEFTNRINKNENLSKEEKDVFLFSTYFLQDYREFFSEKDLLLIADNVKIVYEHNNGFDSFFDTNNCILYVNTLNEEYTLSLNHILSIYRNNHKLNNYSEYIFQMVNNVFYHEYTYAYSDVTIYDDYYEKDVYISNFIFRLLGDEFLFYYKFNPSHDSIVSYLNELGFSLDDVYKLLDLLDNVYVSTNSSGFYDASKYDFELYQLLLYYKIKFDFSNIHAIDVIHTFIDNLEENYEFDYISRTASVKNKKRNNSMGVKFLTLYRSGLESMTYFKTK